MTAYDLGAGVEYEDVGVDVELTAQRDCAMYLAGHTPHWIQVQRVAPQRGHVFGTLHAERTDDTEGEWVFRFTPDTARDHTLPDEDCVETVLFNHDPDRLIAALASCGDIGRWTPGVHLFQIEHRDGWPTFDMSPSPIGPCQPRETEPWPGVNAHAKGHQT